MEASFFAAAEAVLLLVRLRELFAQQGIEFYMVGGYVRDGLLGRINNDIDLTVAGDAISIAREVADAFEAKFVLLDEMHQVARVVLIQNQERVYLDFAAMRGSIEDDLAHRDFTVDAIAMKLDQVGAGWTQVQLIDPLGGAQDLERRLIRVVSDSAFRDDPGRLLRAFRLAAELDFAIDKDTEDLVHRDCHLITEVSGERVRDELGHLLETPRAARFLRHLDRLGLLDLIIPELVVSKGVEQPKEHFWDVFDHSIETVAAVERLLQSPAEDEILFLVSHSSTFIDHFNEEITAGRTRKTLLKLAALLHDIAKPHTKTIEPNGRMRFLGHAKQGTSMAASILERLHFSSREKRMVSKMIEHHLRPGHLSNADELPTHRAIYRYFRDTADVGIDTLFLSLADHLATRGPRLEMAAWQEHVERTQYILSKWFEEQTTVSPPKLINGHDLINKFGLAPGPKIGQLLEAVREAQASGEISTPEEAFEFVRKELGKDYATKR